MKEVYFDNASTALPIFKNNSHEYANPSTSHKLGVQAAQAIYQARKEFLRMAGCNKSDVVFTSGGTESNNLAIIGYALANKRNKICFYALPWAHPSVLEPMKHASSLGFGTSEALDVNNISLKQDCNFISLPHVCHETGNIFDVEGIALKFKKINSKTVVHIDGVQGFCKEKLCLKNIDLYSFSSHKLHGPAGVGGLFIKKGVRLSPIMFGGKQEKGIRAGTENINGIICFTEAALYLYENMEKFKEKVIKLKQEFLKIKSLLDGVTVNSHEAASPYILSLSFKDVLGEILMNMLSEKGIYVSTGAACKTGDRNVPPLIKMGFGKETSDSSIRLGFSHYNTMEEVVYARDIIKECVESLRKVTVKKRR